MSISHAMRSFYANNQILEQYKKKEISAEDLDRFMAMAGVQAKLLTIEIAAQKVATADNKTLKRLQSSGFISTSSIPVEANVTEMVPCVERGGKMVTYIDCCDYSGSEHHIDKCQRCDFFGESRKNCFPT